MFSIQSIVTSCYRKAVAEFPEGTSIAWPGVSLETDSIAEWFELWCDEESDLPRRSASPERRQVALTIHAFARPGMQTTRIYELSEAARQAFSGQVMPVFECGAELVVGHVRFREADVRDLTRLDGEVAQRPLHHVVVMIRGDSQAMSV